MGVSSGSSKAFGWLSNMSAVTGMLNWMGICITLIRFRKGLKVRQFTCVSSSRAHSCGGVLGPGHQHRLAAVDDPPAALRRMVVSHVRARSLHTSAPNRFLTIIALR